MPRRAHDALRLPDRDPVAVLEAQNATRVPALVPVRMGRMLQSPFTFYRGSAAVMAHDLATSPVTGTMVVCCGDAHISNFGVFASPERKLIFDLNDFDEAAVAPWEWDLKRLTTSVVLAGRDAGKSDDQARDAATAAARSYRETLARLVRMTALERFYFTVSAADVEAAAGHANRAVVSKTARKAMRRTSDQVLSRLTVQARDGERRIVPDPPILVPAEDKPTRRLAADAIRRYRQTAREDVIVLLDKFRMTDVAMRVVGVGSVGTRCFIALLVGPSGEPLFVQAKEALPSSLETHGGIAQPVVPGAARRSRPSQGRRVVAYQRVLQSHSDPFLGWLTGLRLPTGQRTDFYFRQFRDMKGAPDLGRLTADQIEAFGGLCASLLARAHSQSPGGMEVAGYLGRSPVSDEAVGRWSLAYADVVERDYAELSDAARTGRIPVEHGV